MEQHSISRRHVLGLTGLAALGAVAGTAGTQADATINPGPPQNAAMLPGPIGISSGELARLSAVYYGGGIPGGGCVVALEILDLGGELQARQLFQLSPGQGASVETAGGQHHQQVYGVVRHVEAGTGRAEHVIGGTLEVVDAETGRTGALLAPIVWTVNDPSLLVVQ